jgi:predicted membrane protein
MKNRRILLNTFISFGALLALAPLLNAGVIERGLAPSQPTFITFDPPGAVNGTYGQAITAAGMIAGTYIDENFLFHGFVQDKDGTITSIDAPDGTMTETGGNDVFAPGAMNPAGAITGTYFDENFVSHGFLRSSDGTLTTIDAPGAVYGTNAEAVSAVGVITGFYTDASFAVHGFLRSPDGAITTFDAPGAFVTQPSGLNVQGTVIGQAFDENSAHGFVRAPDGSCTIFDPTGSAYTLPSDINAEGAITGYYIDATELLHGFLRSRGGAITTFDVPGAGTGSFQGTSAGAINAIGIVTGYYADASGVVHGFVRARNGAITTFDVPGSTGTLALAINAIGLITGTFSDLNGVPHGFVRMP